MRRLLYIWMLLIAGPLSGQITFTHKAFKAYQEDRLQEAAAFSDSSITDAEEMKSAQTWHIRGFIYKEIYKSAQKDDAGSSAREKSFEAFIQSMELDTDSSFSKQNVLGVKYIATSYYNQGVLTLNPSEYINSIKSYDRYKEILRSIEPNHDFNKQDVEYYNALGSMLSSTFDKNKIKYAEYADLAIKYLKYTLEIEHDNLTANQQIGVIFYNRGVDLILDLDPEASLDVLIEVQDKCVELFLRAEPYLLQAHQKDPTNCEIITGLKGVRFNLNDKEQVKQWDTKLKELGCRVDE